MITNRERDSSIRPIVTIGVCVRNCEDYVGEAIESVLDQDFPHKFMEVVFVDDGSEDETLAVIREHTSEIDIPVEVFHTPWKGLGHARNVVIENAHGDLILWVDGDMLLSQGFVRKLVTFMERYPKVGIVKGRQALKPARNLLATLESFSRTASRMVDYRSERGRSKALGTGGSMYRVDVIRQVGGFDESLRGYGEDWDIEIRARTAGWSLCSIDAEFLDYERHGLTWRNLWTRYWLRGYHMHNFLHKNKGMLKHCRINPPVTFMNGILQAFTLYKLTGRKEVFALPFQSAFKATAWYLGFIRSHRVASPHILRTLWSPLKKTKLGTDANTHAR